MAGKEPERKYNPLGLGGVLDESVSPSKVGGRGLTIAQNLVYRRFGSWGKRSGSTPVYAAVNPPVPGNPPAPGPPFNPAPPTPPSPPDPPPHAPKPNPGRPFE